MGWMRAGAGRGLGKGSDLGLRGWQRCWWQRRGRTCGAFTSFPLGPTHLPLTFLLPPRNTYLAPRCELLICPASLDNPPLPTALSCPHSTSWGCGGGVRGASLRAFLPHLGLQWESSDQFQAEWGTSLVVQWLGLCTSTAEGVGSIPGQGTKIP